MFKNVFKTFLTEHFQNLQVCPSERVNESIDLQYVVQKLHSLNMTETVAEKLQKFFISVNFNLNDKFRDGNDLNDSWQNLPISNEILAFFHRFSTLIQQNCIRTTQNILIHIEQTLKLKMTITKIVINDAKITQPVLVLIV